jgi:formamidopyrimidine-DNA glycosylase
MWKKGYKRGNPKEYMPELPDLELLKERLHILCGDSIVSVDVRFPLTFRLLVAGNPEEVLSSQKVHHVKRRGKFLILTLDQVYLVFNLMVTGRLHLTSQSRIKPHTTVVFTFASGSNLLFTDIKKMGKIYVADTLETIPQYQTLGVEPLSAEFTLKGFSEFLNDSRPIKIVLTDQKVIAGIGNGYSDEILFHAKVNPQKKAESLTQEEIAGLYDSIHYVLTYATCEIRKRVDNTSEIRDFFSVHGKKGQSCPVCGSVIREIEVTKRVTHICPRCQNVKFPL